MATCVCSPRSLSLFLPAPVTSLYNGGHTLTPRVSLPDGCAAHNLALQKILRHKRGEYTTRMVQAPITFVYDRFGVSRGSEYLRPSTDGLETSNKYKVLKSDITTSHHHLSGKGDGGWWACYTYCYQRQARTHGGYCTKRISINTQHKIHHQNVVGVYLLAYSTDYLTVCA